MDSETESALRAAPAPLWERQNWLRKATLESVLEVNEQVLALANQTSAILPLAGKRPEGLR